SSKRGVMRNILITAAIMAGLGTFMAQMADKMTPEPASATASATIAKAVPAEMPAQAGVRSLNVGRDARGHFATEGRIDDQRRGHRDTKTLRTSAARPRGHARCFVRFGGAWRQPFQ